VYDAVVSILDAMSAKSPPYEHLSLKVGAAVMPISIRTRHNQRRYESELTIEANAAAGAFPRFNGTMTVTPVREYGCELWLQGNYEAPFGSAGDVVDQTIMRDAARNSLQRWFNQITAAIHS
jgi:hypothetical protein